MLIDAATSAVTSRSWVQSPCPGRGIIGTRQSAITILAASKIAPTWLCLVDYQVLSITSHNSFSFSKMPTNANGPMEAPCQTITDFPVQFPDETRNFPVRGRREFSRKTSLSFRYSAPFGCSQQRNKQNSLYFPC